VTLTSPVHHNIREQSEEFILCASFSLKEVADFFRKDGWGYYLYKYISIRVDLS